MVIAVVVSPALARAVAIPASAWLRLYLSRIDEAAARAWCAALMALVVSPAMAKAVAISMSARLRSDPSAIVRLHSQPHRGVWRCRRRSVPSRSRPLPNSVAHCWLWSGPRTDTAIVTTGGSATNLSDVPESGKRQAHAGTHRGGRECWRSRLGHRVLVGGRGVPAVPQAPLTLIGSKPPVH